MTRRTSRPIKPRALTPLSPEQIDRRENRALPTIAHAKRHEEAADGNAAAPLPPRADDSRVNRTTVLPLHVHESEEPGAEAVLDQTRRRPPATEPLRQMTVWEDREDDLGADVLAGWIEASTRRPHQGVAAPVDTVDAGAACYRIGATRHRLTAEERRAHLMQVGTRDDPHLIKRVRPAVVDLVLEHPYMSEEADNRLTALGIRFGVWSMTRTADGAFDPYRDLTADRISAFARDVGRHLSAGSVASYKSALRRIAAGPAQPDRSARRTAVEPHSRMVEDGLWIAAESFHPLSWRHGEAKTLLAATFGAGAMPAEINRLAPDDVLIGTASTEPRVSLRLTRDRTWETRDVPVVEVRYAEWLAARADQFAGQTYLFKPEVIKRRNAINATKGALAQSNAAFERYDLPAARNAWAVRWLKIGIPFEVWAKAAGINPGTHLPTDLLPFLPTPSTDDIERAFRRAALRTSPPV